MWNRVQGKNIRICQWCTSTIVEDKHPVFKIPEFITVQAPLSDEKKVTVALDKEEVMWRGVFCCPGCATAALKQYSDKMKLSQEMHNFIMDVYKDSLHRKDKGEVTETLKFNIVAAPNPKTLKVFGEGGSMTLEEYHKNLDTETMNAVFTQELPKEPVASEGEDGDGKTRQLVGNWQITEVDSDMKVNHEQVANLETAAQGLPRNASSVVCYLEEMANLLQDTNINPGVPYVVYPHPEREDSFGIGLPQAWQGEDPDHNNLASRLLGSVPVFGDVLIYHKKNLKLKKGKKKSRSSPKLPTDETTQPAQPAPAPVPAPLPLPVVSEPEKAKIPRKRPAKASSKETKDTKEPKAKKPKVAKPAKAEK